MSIYEEVLTFIAGPDPSAFEALGLKVFRHQFERVDAYREYCLAIGIRPERVHRLNDVPPVSTLAFKYAPLHERSAADNRDTRIFLTSGTTIGREERGRHVVARPEVYRASAVAHLERMLFPDRARLRMLALHPTAERMPESSLGQMITWCIEEFGREPNLCAAKPEGIDLDSAVGFLHEAERDGVPVCILGTTASLSSLFERLKERGKGFRLAAGSRAMDTGGAKGQAVPMSAEQVISECGRWMGIVPAMVVNEYGMTELCSQLYDATPLNSDDAGEPGRRAKIAPAWLGCASVDPVTLRPVPAGTFGLLRFFDLANVGSVSCILTEDFGRVEDGRVYLAGRAAMADVRGCALGVEQFRRSEPSLGGDAR